MVVLPVEFEIAGARYRAAPLDAFQQFSIARKLAPILLGLSSIEMAPKVDGAPAPTAERYAKAICAMSSRIPQDDMDASLAIVTASVSRATGIPQAPWTLLREPITGKLLFADLDLMGLLQILYFVLKANRLTDFFVAPPATSGDPTPAA